MKLIRQSFYPCYDIFLFNKQVFSHTSVLITFNLHRMSKHTLLLVVAIINKTIEKSQ